MAKGSDVTISTGLPEIPVVARLDVDASYKAIKGQLDSIAKQLQSGGGLKINVDVDPQKIKSQAATAFSEFSEKSAMVANKAMSQKVALLTQVDVAGKKYINTIQQQTESEKKRAQAAKAADAEAAKASNDVIRKSRERLQLDKELAAEAKRNAAKDKAINAEAIATAKLNQERDRAIATTKLLEAQFPKMAGTAYQTQFDAIVQGLNDQTMSGKEANAQLILLRKNMTAAGLAGQTMGNQFKAALSKFAQYISVSTIILTGIRGIKQMISNVAELDASLVEFNKVADLTQTQLEKITDEAFTMGEVVGRTGKDVIDAATEFKRAGYELQSSMEMAKAALVMTNVGDGIESTADAASVLIAALRGFEKPDSEAMAIVDLINQVSNTSPIAFENIAEGLTRVAGTLHLTGTSIEETIGLLTGGFAQLRNIEKVSSGLIMISQRLRGVEEDGSSVDGLAAKVAKEFKDVGVEVEATNGELRSTFDILKDYAAVYDTLGSKKIQYLGEDAAGNRQITVLNAIMQQWEDVEKAVGQATNSVGSAEKENAIFIDSIQGRVQQLQSSWQELSSSVIDSDLIKFFVDLGAAATKGLTWSADNLGTLPTILTLLGSAGLLKNLSFPHVQGTFCWAIHYKLAA